MEFSAVRLLVQYLTASCYSNTASACRYNDLTDLGEGFAQEVSTSIYRFCQVDYNI